MIELTMDSAVFAHVCPEKFASWVPMQRVDKNKFSTALLANGEKVAVLGSRKVLLVLGSHLNRPLKVELQFLVLKIRRPIISLGMLVASGNVVHLEQEAAYVQFGLHRVPLRFHANFFYLRAEMEQQFKQGALPSTALMPLERVS